MKLKTLLKEMIEKKELHLFDFDGTLFRSPRPTPDFDGKMEDWYRNPDSLNHPVVPEVPDGSWWNRELLRKAEKSIRDQTVHAVMATGRRTPFADRIKSLINSTGLHFDEVHLKKDGRTNTFKTGLIHRILKQYPTIETVHIWDDRVHHLDHFQKELDNHKVDIYTYPVDIKPKVNEMIV